MTVSSPSLSVVIPTYRRGAILVATLDAVGALQPSPREILVVDQTETYPEDIQATLQARDAAGAIRWIRLAQPSIPRAMNTGLREARCPVVLFLDDDILPHPDLLAAHTRAHEQGWEAVCGQVLQPGEEPTSWPRRTGGHPLTRDLDFMFSSDQATEIQNMMAGNLSLDRSLALDLGGFDENFLGAAYRFETDYARRWCAAGHRIRFEPAASLHHLRATTGGTRSEGDHLSAPSAHHAVGDYYFAFKHGKGWARIMYVLGRLRRELINRYYRSHPGRLPAKIRAERTAFRMAKALMRKDPS